MRRVSQPLDFGFPSGGRQMSLPNVLDVARARVEGLDLLRVNIQPEDPDPGLRKTQGKGQADIAESDNGNGGHKLKVIFLRAFAASRLSCVAL